MEHMDIERQYMGIDEFILQYDYKNILKYFKEISGIPRGSGNCTEISRYLMDFAEKKGIRAYQDASGTVILYKAASKGYENVPAVIIQGHMDMVCVKKDGSIHDFTKEGISLLAEGEYIKADQTTLGADDGIALAYGLALLEDDTCRHPALEFLFTTDEETGMYGAEAFDSTKLSGRMLINIDSEKEDTVLVSCVGGSLLRGMLPLRYDGKKGCRVQIQITGLKGGHSGMDIADNRANAVLLMARLLFMLKKDTDFSLITMQGGEKDNAVPSSCHVEICISDIAFEKDTSQNEDRNPSGGDQNDRDQDSRRQIEAVMRKLEACGNILKQELAAAEPDFELIVQDAGMGSYQALSEPVFQTLLFLFLQSPAGVLGMSSVMKGLVESSVNLGVFYMKDGYACIQYSIRSSLASYITYVKDKITQLLTASYCSVEVVSEYPAWEYQEVSPLRELYARAYYQEHQQYPIFMAVHAGLECGIISEKLPGMDMISIGPDMSGIHTPLERLHVVSAVRLYKLLEKVLESIKEN